MDEDLRMASVVLFKQALVKTNHIMLSMNGETQLPLNVAFLIKPFSRHSHALIGFVLFIQIRFYIRKMNSIKLVIFHSMVFAIPRTLKTKHVV